MFKHVEIGASFVQDVVDSQAAGFELAERALAKIEAYEPSVCFFFASTKAHPYNEILKGIRDAIDSRTRTHYGQHPTTRIPIVGCSTIAAIHKNRVLEQGASLLIWASPHIRAHSSVAEQVFSDRVGGLIINRSSISNALRKLNLKGDSGTNYTDSPKCLFAMTPGFAPRKQGHPNPVSRNEEVVECIVEELGYRRSTLLSVWGGSAVGSSGGRGHKRTNAYQFCGHQKFENSVVFCTIYSELRIGVGMGFGFKHTNTYFPATKIGASHANDSLFGRRMIEEIDDKPAVDFFPPESVDFKIPNVEIPAKNVLYSVTDNRTGSIFTTYPHIGAGHDKSVFFAPRLSNSFTLSPVHVDHKHVIEGAAKALDHALDFGEISTDRLCSVLTVSCRGRLRRMKIFAAEDNEKGPGAEFAALIGNTEVEPVGFYGNGEIGVSSRRNLMPAYWANSIVALGDEFDPVSMNDLGESARRKAARFVQELSKQLTEIESSYSLLQMEEHELWTRCARTVNSLVDGAGCSLFFKDSRAHFHLGGSTGEVTRPTTRRSEPPWSIYYRIGEGLTGWVAEMGVTLNLTKRTERYLDKLYEVYLKEQVSATWKDAGWGNPPDRPPRWGNHFTENPDDADKPSPRSAPFLATPIFVGTKIVGLIRVSGVNENVKGYFTLEDEYIVRACARVVSLAFAVLERARKLRWEEIGFLNWASHHQLGGAVQSLNTNTFMFQDLLQELKKAGTSKELLNKVEARSAKLRDISDFVTNTYARFKEVTQMDIQTLAPIDMHCFLKDFTTQLNVANSNRPRQLNVTYKNTSKVFIEGSAVALRILLRELVINAAEAISTSEIGSEITINLDEQDQDHLILTVSDNGPGIQTTDDNKNKSRLRGSGLAICEFIARQHDANFHISNSGNGGNSAHIVFHLPDKESPS